MKIFNILKFFKSKKKPSFNTDKNVIIISHDDVDGIICASIIKRKFGDGFYIPSSPRNLSNHLAELNVENKTIILSDLSPNEEQLDSIAQTLEKVYNSKCEVIWIDHHSWPADSIERLGKHAKIYVEPAISAAELVAKVFGMNDDIIENLVRIANDADSATYATEEAININRALRNKKRLQYIFEVLSEGKINDEKILKWAKKEQRNDEKIKEYVKTLPVYTTKSNFRYTIIDVRKTKLPGSLTGKYASLEHKLDFTVVIYSNRSVSLYAGLNKNVNLLKIARRFNGGGHPFACGCSPKLSLKSKILDKLFGKRYTAKEIKEVLKAVSEL
ncbi:MAG TPA: DHH family phosphoesterase [Geobacterales bacterium]|nr:DHH family phosphoesterase [Geobacterales bacterium]